MPVTKKTRKKKNVSQKKTYVAIVLDRSGSMSSIQRETVSGLNEQIGTLRAMASDGGTTEVSLFQFDNVIEPVFVDENANELTEINQSDFVPRGGTAMYDAVMHAIAHLKTKPVNKGDDVAFLICVISDGEENSSREVTQVVLSNEIKELQALGNWTFTYMLANQDIHTVSKTLNVPIGNFSSYSATSTGTTTAWAGMNNASANYLSARHAGVATMDSFFDTTTTNGSTQVTLNGTVNTNKT